MSQNTSESSYGSHNEHGGEHKDQPRQAVQGGGVGTESTPANTEDGKAGVKTATTHDPADQPAFAYRKPGGHETLGDKVAKALDI